MTESNRRKIGDWFEQRLTDLIAKYGIEPPDATRMLLLVMAYRGDIDVEFDTEAGEPIFKKPPAVQ